MKVALILHANMHCSPYVKIYSKILDELNIEYEFLAWDRSNTGETGGLFFRKEFPYGEGKKLKWFFNYYGYAKFIKYHLITNKYDKLVVFGPQVAFFLFLFLKRRYCQKFCFDYRDIFIEQYFPKLFRRLLQMSVLNVISSPGFKPYLPKGFDYVLSHNFDIETLIGGLSRVNIDKVFTKPAITILTIGSIRDYEENYQVMKAFYNKPDYLIKFIGRPNEAGARLQQICTVDQQQNVEFVGFYKDEDEPSLINGADFINIFRPDNYICASSFTNRFYYSLIYKKPLLVTKGSLEGMYVEKYKLGLVLENCSQLDEQIQSFVSDFNQKEFDKNCNKLLGLFLADYQVFKRRFIDFISI